MKFLRLRLNRPRVTRRDSMIRRLARHRTPDYRVNTQLDGRDHSLPVHVGGLDFSPALDRKEEILLPFGPVLCMR
jgi:hypothetical protein